MRPMGPQLTNMLNPGGGMCPVTSYDAYQYRKPVIDSTITAIGVNSQPIRDGVYARNTIGEPISPTFGKPHSCDTIGQPDYIYPARVPKHDLTRKFDNNSFNFEPLKPVLLNIHLPKPILPKIKTIAEIACEINDKY